MKNQADEKAAYPLIAQWINAIRADIITGTGFRAAGMGLIIGLMIGFVIGFVIGLLI